MSEVILAILFIGSLLFFTGAMFVGVLSAIKSAKQTKEMERRMKK